MSYGDPGTGPTYGIGATGMAYIHSLEQDVAKQRREKELYQTAANLRDFFERQSLNDWVNALKETDGNMVEAITWIRRKGLAG